MQKWEYKVEMLFGIYTSDHDLNAEGANGWELVGIYKENGTSYAVFKRPK